LEINEDSGHKVNVLWKQPVQGEVGVKLVPHLTSGWLETAPSDVSSSHSFLIKRWEELDGNKTKLEGQTIQIEGLDATITDVLVVVNLADGRTIQQIITPQTPTLKISENTSGTLPVLSYTILGIEHILTGVDHLIFVLGLMLLVSSTKILVRTITAFTIAHSITLSAAALGLVSIHPSVIEAIIAMSVVFLGVELVHKYQGRDGLTVRYPWLIAFSFGLLHGFGFAGALLDVGLPKGNIPLALLLFNVGVEIGQLLFVAASLLVIWLIQKTPLRKPDWTRFVTPYAIGSFAAFWFIERLFVY
jgi:hydrogenase/urease accessory protein HupE